MKNYEMFNFVREFAKFNELEGFDFLLRINKNKRLFEQEIQDLQKQRESNPGFKAYKEKTQELLVKYSDKDAKGEPIIEPIPSQPGQGNYKISNREDFNKEHAILITEYKGDIDKQTKLDTDFNEGMDKEILCSPYYIKEDLLPRNIKSEQMNLLYSLIKFKPEVLEDITEELPEAVLEKVD